MHRVCTCMHVIRNAEPSVYMLSVACTVHVILWFTHLMPYIPAGWCRKMCWRLWSSPWCCLHYPVSTLLFTVTYSLYMHDCTCLWSLALGHAFKGYILYSMHCYNFSWLFWKCACAHMIICAWKNAIVCSCSVSYYSITLPSLILQLTGFQVVIVSSFRTDHAYLTKYHWLRKSLLMEMEKSSLWALLASVDVRVRDLQYKQFIFVRTICTTWQLLQ